MEWNMTFEFPESMKAFGDWAREQEDKFAEMTKFLTHFESFGGFLVGLLVIAVIPAIGEEFVFRGLIQNELWRNSRNVHVTPFGCRLILFSAIHMQFFGFVPRDAAGRFVWISLLLVGQFINTHDCSLL
jgi:membrane protease YdiL (CAAX protease family)